MARVTLTDEEKIDFERVLHYALGTQFGEVPHRARKAAVKNVLTMYLEDLLTARLNPTPEHILRKK